MTNVGSESIHIEFPKNYTWVGSRGFQLVEFYCVTLVKGPLLSSVLQGLQNVRSHWEFVEA